MVEPYRYGMYRHIGTKYNVGISVSIEKGGGGGVGREGEVPGGPMAADKRVA